jgi:hypothetical protein
MTQYRVLEDTATGSFYPQRKRSWYLGWEYFETKRLGRMFHHDLNSAYRWLDRFTDNSKPNSIIHEYPPKQFDK